MDPPRSSDPIQTKAPDGTTGDTRPPRRARQARLRAADSSPEAVLARIRSYLGEGRYQDAQALARKAVACFPEHPDVSKMDRALNRWAATTRPATGVDRSEEREWMRQELPESLSGKVVALVGKEVVATAETFAELDQQIQSLELTKRPLVFRVA